MHTTYAGKSIGHQLLDDIPRECLAQLITENANLRSVVQGYISEYHLKNYLETVPGVTDVRKIPDRDKKRGDFSFQYNGREVTMEAKSFQVNSVREEIVEGGVSATVQLKSSDCATTTEGGRTTCLLPSQFDILAISSFGVNGEWDFHFMHSRYLPTSLEFPGRLQSSVRLNLDGAPCLHRDLNSVLQDLD